MLYFSKIKIITVLIITLVLIYFSLSNLFKFDDNFIKNKINLGLDLQGGSYLLLEIDNQPIISQTLQMLLPRDVICNVHPYIYLTYLTNPIIVYQLVDQYL